MQLKNFILGKIKSVKGIFNKSINSRGLSPLNLFGLGDIFSWSLGSKSLQLMSYKNIVVYSIVNVLVRKQIEVPIIVYKEKNKIENRRLKRFNFKKGNELGKYNIIQNKALEEIESHDIIDLLSKPNKYQTGLQLREHFWFNYNLTGDGFLWAETLEDGARAGKVMKIHSLQADKVTIVRNYADNDDYIAEYRYTDWNGTQYIISPKNIMHLSKWSFEDPILGGFSPLIAGAKTIARNDANQIAQGEAFKNKGTGIIISSDVGLRKDASGNESPYFKFTDGQIKKMEDNMQKDWAGFTNSQKMHITNGKVEVQKLGDTLVDLDAINAEKGDWKNIGAIYGVNPILVGDMSGGTENNVQASYKALVTNVVVSELRKFDEKFNDFMAQFYKNESIEIKHDLTEFSELAPDLERMKNVYGNSWQVTPNEYREIVNLERSNDPNMDKIYVPSSYIALDDLNTDDFNLLNNGGSEQQRDYN